MGGNAVELGRTLNPEQLEEILIKAAKDLKWKTKIRPRTRRAYKLNPVDSIHDVSCKDLYVSGTFLPLFSMEIQNTPSNRFLLYTGHTFGVALKSEVKKYLQRVSYHLSKCPLQNNQH